MPVAIALIIGVVMLAISFIGLVWTLVLLFPFYAYIAVAVFLMRRSNWKHAELSASIMRESQMQKQFNEQEMRAWEAALDIERRKQSRRKEVLRRFDSTRKQ